MSRRNYPLNSLRAFEAAARRLSFVKAAEELSVTPAAVSHLVKKLEEYVGMQLFRRLSRGLLLTEAGQQLAIELRAIFESMDKVMDRVTEGGRQKALTISVAPTFAVMWLIPRLQKFYELHPDMDLRISTSLGLVDFQRDNVDAVIRLGNGQWQGLETIKLFDETVTPVCSPRLLDGLKEPNDLRHHVLLHNDSMNFDPDAPTWETWLAAAGATEVDAHRGPHFSLPDHGLQASIDGAGVVLGWRNLTAEDLAAGRVVQPFDLELSLGSSFYLAYPNGRAEWRNIRTLRDWLMAEVASGA